MRHHYLRAVTLGTSLTALFLLVRCSVPGRDYSPLGIGEHAGSGGEGGSLGNDVVLTSGGTAGQDGLADAGDQGGQGGAPPLPPIPCVAVIPDAGSIDAGTDAGSIDAGADAGTDAGSSDAGSPNEPCACVDGFIKAVDADGDGEGTRACAVAPGPDCDDDNASVTHNSCGGCSTLPNAIGEDCLECGAYICDGPEAVVCASKPGPVIDPDCQCQDALIVARDTDGDGEGTRLCEQSPGTDCDDGNGGFVTDACGGCNQSPPGALGTDCNQCGVYTCNGSAIVCGPNPAAGGHCTDDKNRQTCNSNGFWGNDADCPNVCYQGNCEVCTPGTFTCTFYATGDAVSKCIPAYSTSSSAAGIGWASYGSCSGTTLRCNPTDGSCTTGFLFLPKDQTFDVVPLLRPGLPWHDVLNTASDSDYG